MSETLSKVKAGFKYVYLVAFFALLAGFFNPLITGSSFDGVISGVLVLFVGLAGGVLLYKSAICNPTTNSYHRLVPGYEAPAYIAWSSGNRSAIVRVPKHLTGKNYAYLKRLEFRAPDPSSNPYLAFAAVTAAGMDGIKKKTDPGEPILEDIFKMTKSDRAKRGIGVLPKSLGEALDELESDRKFLTPIYTNDVIDKIIELERRDQREIAIRPHPHEFYLYFDV